MENRFGIKDFFLFLLITILIVIVVLAMFQYDRQWDELLAIRSRLDGQAQDLRDIQKAIATGVTVNAGNSTTRLTNGDDDKNDPFARLRVAHAKKGYTQGDWIVEAFAGGVAKLTPLLSGDASAGDVQDIVLESLATRDPETLEYRPLLSTEWEITDNSTGWQTWVDAQKVAGKSEEEIKKYEGAPTAVKIRFKLRDNVRFSDGTPMTADDVVFTYDFIMNPAIAAPRHRAYLERIRKVEKLGPLEVVFHFAEPYFEAFNLTAGFQVMPKHFYGAYETNAFNDSVGLLMGSGPYRMESPTNWKPGTPIYLVRNERYWGLSPGFDRMVYNEISSDKGRQSAFRNGEIDIFGATPDQYREMKSDPELMKRVLSFEYQNPVGGYGFVAWNQKNPLFADKRVRQALTMLLDRERIIQEVFLGYAVTATGPFNPLGSQNDPNIQPWPHDVERAKKQLIDAGFQDRDNDGVIESADGKPFSFGLTYPSGSATYDKLILFAKDSFARAGIVLRPDPLEWAVFTDRLNNKNFEAIALAWTSGIETDIYQMFHSKQTEVGGDNFMSYMSPELDAAIDQARLTMDEPARMKLWQQAHRILHEDQPYTFLTFRKSLIFLDNRLHNVERVKVGLNPRVEWFVPGPLHKYKQ